MSDHRYDKHVKWIYCSEMVTHVRVHTTNHNNWIIFFTHALASTATATAKEVLRSRSRTFLRVCDILPVKCKRLCLGIPSGITCKHTFTHASEGLSDIRVTVKQIQHKHLYLRVPQHADLISEAAASDQRCQQKAADCLCRECVCVCVGRKSKHNNVESSLAVVF